MDICQIEKPTRGYLLCNDKAFFPRFSMWYTFTQYSLCVLYSSIILSHPTAQELHNCTSMHLTEYSGSIKYTLQSDQSGHQGWGGVCTHCKERTSGEIGWDKISVCFLNVYLIVFVFCICLCRCLFVGSVIFHNALIAKRISGKIGRDEIKGMKKIILDV